MKKLRVGVVFGGRSVEHEVSIVSAAGVIAALNKNKYHVVPIGITPAGEWIVHEDAVGMFRRAVTARELRKHRYTIAPEPGPGGAARPRAGRTERGTMLKPVDPGNRNITIDVFFPLLHGSYGEDGKLQGVFEMAGAPYVGAAVAGSAVGMDKTLTKKIWQNAGLPVTPFVSFRAEWYKKSAPEILSSVRRSVGFPCFVKPVNSGSSIGISKVRNARELSRAIGAAFRYDRSVIVERAVPGAREIEVGVIGNAIPKTTLPGEIIPSNEFYDYDAKYVDGKSESVIPARIPAWAVRRIREMAALGYSAINCEGMARVDFLTDRACRRIYLSEINTIPGFTPSSMFPKLWEATGISYGRLLDELITFALERHVSEMKLSTLYKPATAWHRGSP